jgi:hypothetical protein
MNGWRARLVTVVAMVLTLSGCTGPADREMTAWPDPSPTRPVVDIEYVVSDNLRTVTGSSRVHFTPDLRVCELMFRAWPNKPTSAVYGTSMEVTRMRVDGRAVHVDTRAAGAPRGTPGTLVVAPLPRCIDPGTRVSAETDFSVTLGTAADERVGVSTDGDVAWFAGAFPLLAWENGRGWADEPAVAVPGESSTSEQFRLRSLSVTAPARYDVLGTGAHVGSTPSVDAPDPGLVTHRFQAPAVRDVSVTVGVVDVMSRDIGGTWLHVAVPRSGTRSPLPVWVDRVERSVREISALLGPFPYSDLWVSVLPDQTDGIEMSGVIHLGDVSPIRDGWLIDHEVAHMWFFGLVGNNQARDPWLDEAFATLVQRMVDDSGPTRNVSPGTYGEVGAPMRYWESRPGQYVPRVYLAGGDALLHARAEVGAEDFDAALQGYLADNAHRVASPADVEDAFAELPEVLDILRDAGALGSAW